MTKYFVAKVYLFDEEDYNTAERVRQEIEFEMDLIVAGNEGLLWEEVIVKEVELEEYKKED